MTWRRLETCAATLPTLTLPSDRANTSSLWRLCGHVSAAT